MLDSSIFILLLGAVFGQSASPAGVDVRVGIVAYEDFHAEREQFRRLFAELSARDRKLRFRIAVGTYGDVLHWIERRQVDLAVLTPGVFAELVPRGSKSSPTSFEYLVTAGLPAATSPWVDDDRRSKGTYDWYRSVCLVGENSSLQTIDDLRREAQDGRVEFLFVHPLSASGRRTAQFALRKVGIEPRLDRVRYTYSHSESIRLLHSSHPNRPRVAFVWDDAAAQNPDLSRSVRRLPFPELDSLKIPHDVVIAAGGFRYADRIRQALLNVVDDEGHPRFTAIRNWRERYGVVRDWWRESGQRAGDGAEQTVSLDEIGQMLLQYDRSQQKPPRLAVVLSGGGAKCSYQVGAVAALEEKLAELRRQDDGRGWLDISLVVGTSGGAINSLPIALAVSRTANGRKQFAVAWSKLDQREIVQPSLLVRANIGLWFALFQTACVVGLVRLFVRKPQQRGRIFAIVYTSLAVVEILIGYVPASPWRWLGMNHWVHHAWLWLGFGVRASAWSLLTLGIAALLLEAVRARRGRHIAIPNWLTWGTLATGLLGLPLLQVLTVATVERTLSGGQGMEHAVADQFSELMDAHVTQRKLAPLELDKSTDDAGRLRSLSRQIVERKLLQRDLVMTGSCLQQTSESLPSDLYFYLAANPEDAKPPFGKRGISLAKRPAILLDVLLGSGSIFPVFPPRAIAGVPEKGDRIELIDGGFAHNSPVEAAVLWGATHIVLIEASPRKRSQRTNFLQNASASFSHLYQQAQLLDARSREQVVIFSLSPQPPHICVLDFADNLIADSIDRGYRDAAATPANGSPRFRKEPGMPQFVDVTGRSD